MPNEGKNWTFIDKFERRALVLDDSDVCYYYLVRTSGGFTESEANSRVANFKKKPEEWKHNPTVWRYKIAEIARFADDVVTLLSRDDFRLMLNSFSNVAITPMPTSKPKNHKHYDSRLDDMCNLICNRISCVHLEDVFDIKHEVPPAHRGGSRNITDLCLNMEFGGFYELNDLVILVDDVLTTGSHYVACRDMIRSNYPNVRIMGLFLAIHRSDYVDYDSFGIIV